MLVSRHARPSRQSISTVSIAAGRRRRTRVDANDRQYVTSSHTNAGYTCERYYPTFQKDTYSTPHQSRIYRPSRRHYATSSTAPVTDIAVLGGGITGLATTYFLSKEFPKSKITLFEGKKELGGWVKSEKVDVGNGQVLFEEGPRSLRPQPPNGTLTLRVIQELGLTDDVLITSKRAPAARNRFIYYPDHLVRMPGEGMSMGEIFRTLRTEPAFEGLLNAIWKDVTSPKRGDDLLDESVGRFIARRGDKRLADNLASALFHGIYAGDIWQLSAKSILALPWKREQKHRSLTLGGLATAFFNVGYQFCDDVQLQMDLAETSWEPDFRDKIVDCSVFTFKKGLGQLAEGLERKITNSSNVTISRETFLLSLEKEEDASIKILSKPSQQATAQNYTSKFSHVISTIAPSNLTPLMSKSLLKSGVPLPPSFSAAPATTVSVVNLYYDIPSLLQKTQLPGGLPQSLIDSNTGLQGFGYLMPQNLPLSQNPERALGVIFDSDISPDQWTTVPKPALGTKLTVMLGGHWWDGFAQFPSDTEAEEMARSVLERHLGITDPPTAVRTTLQRNCIPQYVVGHELNMAQTHKALQKTYDGRLRVAGSWYTGVGVNDCVRSAWDVVQGLGAKAKSRHGNPTLEARTGLERFHFGRPLVLTKREKPGVLEVLEVEEEGSRMDYFPGVKVEGRSSG